jgi:hypothetical protein
MVGHDKLLPNRILVGLSWALSRNLFFDLSGVFPKKSDGANFPTSCPKPLSKICFGPMPLHDECLRGTQPLATKSEIDALIWQLLS